MFLYIWRVKQGLANYVVLNQKPYQKRKYRSFFSCLMATYRK